MITVIEAFQRGHGVTDAVVADLDGHQFLFSAHRKGEIRVWPWAPAFDGPPWDNPAWDKLHELIEGGEVEYVMEGLSIAPDDRYVWHGPPIPCLSNEEK